jgi:lysophospholipase L1-like esterase
MCVPQPNGIVLARRLRDRRSSVTHVGRLELLAPAARSTLLRATIGVMLAAAVLSSCSQPEPSQVSTSYRNPAVSYTGAWSTGYGVALATQGAATLRVSKTRSLSVRAFGNGQPFRVRVDFRIVTAGQVKDCHGCSTVFTIVHNLSPDPHIITLTNLDAARPLVIGNWLVDRGGVFRQSSVTVTSVHGTFDVTKPFTFFAQNASAIAIDYAPTGVALRVGIDDRPGEYTVATPPRSSAAKYRTLVAWGMARGISQVRISPVSGTLRLADVVLFQAAGLGVPQMVPEAQVDRGPLLAVYGDSIGDGEFTLGFDANSDGFASRLVALRGWRLADLSRDGASATCYGVGNADGVIAAKPDAVIVVLGTNDMIPGPDFQSCDPTLKQLQDAMRKMLSELRTGLPNIPIYVQAILPSTKTPDAVRGFWNAALRSSAQAEHAVFVDPSPDMALKYDYEGPYHPNNRGHQKLAAYWNRILPSLS